MTADETRIDDDHNTVCGAFLLGGHNARGGDRDGRDSRAHFQLTQYAKSLFRSRPNNPAGLFGSAQAPRKPPPVSGAAKPDQWSMSC